VTYRDEQDALEARVQALQTKVRATAQEQQELQQELTDARRDLASMRHEAAAAAPARSTALLVLGAVGAALSVLGNLGWLFVGAGMPRLVSLGLAALASIGIALGLLGAHRITRQKLLVVAAAICLAEVALDPVTLLAGHLPPLYGMLQAVSYLKWGLWVVFEVVVGVAVLRVGWLPGWLRAGTGWLLIAAGGLSGTSLLSLLIVAGEFWFAMGRYGSFTTILGLAGLALVFLRLRRPAPGGAAPGA
jgi:hypothetical protein